MDALTPLPKVPVEDRETEVESDAVDVNDGDAAVPKVAVPETEAVEE